ncbi:MAG: hypothetical protein LH610_09535 [Sphingomonas bacterium]|nr:hypothetical protein [Sphingomonas bacterium]
MSKILLALGVAALAISAPALADKESKGGQDKGGDKGGQSMKTERGNGGGGKQAKVDPGNGGQAMRQAGNGRSNDKAKGGNDRKDFGRDDGRNRSVELDRGNRKFDREDNVRIVSRNFDGYNGGRSGFNGCPPGLDKKDNGCLPPGQAKKYLGALIQSNYADNLVPYQYRSWYRDDDSHFYRSGNGFIYRVSRNNDLVDGIIPLFGGGGYYAQGDQWPDSYNFYNVPQQYRSYYADGGDYNYRYGDGAIYRVNSGSGVVDSIVALLAGDLGVGSQLPNGYDAYNVPFAYRDRYADSADNWYRYNDGYIYQVDPKTRLISAVIDAIV